MRIKLASVILCLLWAFPALGQQPANKSDSGFLPQVFDGWHRVSSSVSQSAKDADPENTAILKEYGLEKSESASYTRDGRKISIRGLQFANGAGGYGAFTFYRQPNWVTEQICSAGASAGTHVIFLCGKTLLVADLDQVTAMSAAELRELGELLPKVSQGEASLPTLPLYLPKQQRANAQFILGPAGLAHATAPVSAEAVDFSLSPDIVLSRFNTLDGQATMMLISYPTPKIAAMQESKIAGSHVQRTATEGVSTFATRRSGPIVSVVSGQIASDAANSLLQEVHYEAEVTWSEPTFTGRRNNIGVLIVGIFSLVGVILAFTLASGIAFGGFRLLMHRYFPGRVVDRPENKDFISLNLRE